LAKKSNPVDPRLHPRRTVYCPIPDDVVSNGTIVVEWTDATKNTISYIEVSNNDTSETWRSTLTSGATTDTWSIWIKQP
jgi:hypothetical protein